MRFISCHIDHFGKLRDYDLDLREGLTAILEPNGWGKSTLAAFFKVMLYGFADERRQKAKRERERYRPWWLSGKTEGIYGGSIVLEHGDVTYELRRVFGQKAEEDVLRVTDLATNLESTALGDVPGEVLYGIDAESFARTVYVAESACEGGATDAVNARIGNTGVPDEDLRQLGSAQQWLADQCNSLSDKRVTGAVKQAGQEIARLRHALDVRPALEERYRLQEESLQEAVRELEGGAERLQELRSAYAKEGGRREQEAEAKHYADLRERVRLNETRLREAQESFGGRVPTEAEVTEAEQRLVQMEALRSRCTALALTEEEAAAQTEMEQLCGGLLTVDGQAGDTVVADDAEAAGKGAGEAADESEGMGQGTGAEAGESEAVASAGEEGAAHDAGAPDADVQDGAGTRESAAHDAGALDADIQDGATLEERLDAAEEIVRAMEELRHEADQARLTREEESRLQAYAEIYQDEHSAVEIYQLGEKHSQQVKDAAAQAALLSQRRELEAQEQGREQQEALLLRQWERERTRAQERREADLARLEETSHERKSRNRGARRALLILALLCVVAGIGLLALGWGGSKAGSATEGSGLTTTQTAGIAVLAGAAALCVAYGLLRRHAGGMEEAEAAQRAALSEEAEVPVPEGFEDGVYLPEERDAYRRQRLELDARIDSLQTQIQEEEVLIRELLSRYEHGREDGLWERGGASGGEDSGSLSFDDDDDDDRHFGRYAADGVRDEGIRERIRALEADYEEYARLRLKRSKYDQAGYAQREEAQMAQLRGWLSEPLFTIVRQAQGEEQRAILTLRHRLQGYRERSGRDAACARARAELGELKDASEAFLGPYRGLTEQMRGADDVFLVNFLQEQLVTLRAREQALREARDACASYEETHDVSRYADLQSAVREVRHEAPGPASPSEDVPMGEASSIWETPGDRVATDESASSPTSPGEGVPTGEDATGEDMIATLASPASMSMDELREEISRSEHAQEALRERIETLRRQLAEAAEELDRLDDVQAQLDDQVQRQQRDRHRLALYRKTRDYLERAQQKYLSDFVQPLQSAYERHYQAMSDTSANYRINTHITLTREEAGDYRPVEAFSSGSQDLSYLCLRLALVDVMYGDQHPFLILDDPFVHLDGDKLRLAMDYLRQVEADYQILYFTCHASRQGAERQL